MKRIHFFCPVFFLASSISAFAYDSIPPGTSVAIRTNDQIRMSNAGADGRVFTGVVANDVADEAGRVLIPRGSDAELIVRRLNNNELGVDLDSITVNRHRYAIEAAEDTRSQRNGVGANKRTGAFVGGGAVLGTILGAIAGGGKGAAIGALAGGGAGAGTQMLTRGHSVNIPAESVLTFRLEQPIRIDVRDTGYDRNGYHYHNQ